MQETQVGIVTHYFTRIGVAAIRLTGTLRVGNTVHILGRSTDCQETIRSMEIEHAAVEEATAGQEIGLKVAERVREGDIVYRVQE